MPKERWTVQENEGGVLADRGLRWAVYDSEERDNKYAAYAFEKSMAEFIARHLNTEQP